MAKNATNAHENMRKLNLARELLCFYIYARTYLSFRTEFIMDSKAGQGMTVLTTVFCEAGLKRFVNSPFYCHIDLQCIPRL